MAEHKFMYGDAIRHGWAQTKKYFEVMFVMGLIYLVFNVAGGVLEYFSGADAIAKHEVREVYQDSVQAESFYLYLQQEGYIDAYGNVQAKLRYIPDQASLILPPEFEDKQFEIYKFLNKKSYRLPFPKFVFLGAIIVLWLINMLITIGFIKAFVMMSRDQKPAVEELFIHWRLMIPYFLGSICYGLAVLAGFILLIIPGIIFMLMFSMYVYLIIDKKMGPIASLKRSRVITKGSRGRLAVFFFLLMLLNIAGALCLLVGLLVTIPITSIAMAYVYDRLENDPAVGGGAAVNPISPVSP